MPNQLEMQLHAIHTSIAEVKRKMNDCVNVNHYKELEEELNRYENARLELLDLMEVEL